MGDHSSSYAIHESLSNDGILTRFLLRFAGVQVAPLGRSFTCIRADSCRGPNYVISGWSPRVWLFGHKTPSYKIESCFAGFFPQIAYNFFVDKKSMNQQKIEPISITNPTSLMHFELKRACLIKGLSRIPPRNFEHSPIRLKEIGNVSGLGKVNIKTFRTPQ
jgi:hypothetical protein